MSRTSSHLSVFLLLFAVSSPQSLTQTRADAPPKAAADLYGDPLPPGAVARFGTIRLRHFTEPDKIVVSPDNSLLATIGAGAHLWDLKTGEEVERFRGKLRAEAMTFSPDGKTLITGSQKGIIEHWDVSSGKLLRTFSPKDQINSFLTMFSRDGSLFILRPVGDRSLFFDVATGAQLPVLETNNQLRNFKVSPDGKFVAILDANRLVRLWNTRTGKVDSEMKLKDGWSTDITFGPDDQLLATSLDDKDVRFFDVATGKETLKVPGGKDWLAISPDKRTMAVDREGVVCLIDMASGKLLQRLQDGSRGRGQIPAVEFSADGRLVVVGNQDCSVRVWETATAKQLLSRPGHRGAIECLSFSPDGKVLASGSVFDGTVIVWDVATSRARHIWDDHYLGVWALAWSPDGSVLASGDGSNGIDNREAVIRLFDAQGGKEIRRIKAHLSNVHSLSFSPDGKQLASVGRDARARVWDPSTGERMQQLRSSDNLGTVSFSGDGKTLLLSAAAGEVEAYRTEDWERTHHLPPYQLAVRNSTHLAFLPDGKTFVTREPHVEPGKPGPTTEICFRNVDKGTLLRSSRLQTTSDASSGGFALSPAGDLYAEGRSSQAGTAVRVWETRTGKLLASYPGLDMPLTAIAFSRDGRWLATGSRDTTILIWDLFASRVRALWSDLAAKPEDVAGARKQLEAAPANAFPWLSATLRTAAEREAGAAPLLARLDDDDFEQREKASSELAKMLPGVRPILEQTLQNKPSPESRRQIEALLKKSAPAEADDAAFVGPQARSLVLLLEGMGTAESRKVLEELAKAPSTSSIARDAKAALRRLETSKPPDQEPRR
jgi:WD40 repeat protein